MATFRVNTPGPSFTVEADNLDQATCKAVSRGFPAFDVGVDAVVQYTADSDGYLWADGQSVHHHHVLRYLHLYKAEYGWDEPFTGCVIYEEA